MAKDTVPRPGMPQSEKDRLGLAAMRAAERATWAPDDELDGMNRDELLAEAGKRRVPVDAEGQRSKTALVKALRAVDPDAKGRSTDEAKAVAAAPQPPADAGQDQADREPGPGQDQGVGAGRDVAQTPAQTDQGREG